MKKEITKKMAEAILGNDGFIETVAGTDFYVAYGESYTVDGSYSTFRAVPIGVEIEDDFEEELLDGSDLYYYGVTIAYPQREGVEIDPDDMFDWAYEYDGDAPEIWDIGTKLPKSLAV